MTHINVKCIFCSQMWSTQQINSTSLITIHFGFSYIMITIMFVYTTLSPKSVYLSLHRGKLFIQEYYSLDIHRLHDGGRRIYIDLSVWYTSVKHELDSLARQDITKKNFTPGQFSMTSEVYPKGVRFLSGFAWAIMARARTREMWRESMSWIEVLGRILSVDTMKDWELSSSHLCCSAR